MGGGRSSLNRNHKGKRPVDPLFPLDMYPDQQPDRYRQPRYPATTDVSILKLAGADVVRDSVGRVQRARKGGRYRFVSPRRVRGVASCCRAGPTASLVPRPAIAKTRALLPTVTLLRVLVGSMGRRVAQVRTYVLLSCVRISRDRRTCRANSLD